MLDSVQGRAPGMAFLPYCSLPELEACMEVWGFMEMIHSRSYTYVIRNVYSDASEVFDTIIKDDKILERASSVTESYNDFINAAHLYDTSNWWKPEWQDGYNSKYEKKELKENLIGQSQMSTSWKVFVLRLFCLVLSHLVNSSLWKGQLRSYPLLQETKTNTLQLPKTF